MTYNDKLDIINKMCAGLLHHSVSGVKILPECRRWLRRYDLSLILYELSETAQAYKKSSLTLENLMVGVSTRLHDDYDEKRIFTLYGLLRFESRHHASVPAKVSPSQLPDKQSRPASSSVQPKDKAILEIKNAQPTNQDKAVASQCSQIIHYSPQTVAKIVHVCLQDGYQPKDVICAVYIYRNSMRRNALNGHPITAPAKYILGIVRQLIPGDADNIIYQIRLQDKRRQVPKSIWRGMHDSRSGDYDDLVYFYGWGECYHAHQYVQSTPPLTLTGKIYLYDKQAVFDYQPVDKSTQLRVAVLFRNALVNSLKSSAVKDLNKLTPQMIKKNVALTKQQCLHKEFCRDTSSHKTTIGVDLGLLQESDVRTVLHYVKVIAKKIRRAEANPENLNYPSIKKYQAFAHDKRVPSKQRAFNLFISGCMANLHRDYQKATEVPDKDRTDIFLKGDLCGQTYHVVMELLYMGISSKQIIQAFQEVTKRVKSPYDVLPTLKGLLLD